MTYQPKTKPQNQPITIEVGLKGVSSSRDFFFWPLWHHTVTECHVRWIPQLWNS